VTGPDIFGIAMQLPDVLLTLHEALARAGGDPVRAAQDTAVSEVWAAAEPEVRAGLLLSAAWTAGRGPEPTLPDGLDAADAVAVYVPEFYRYAAAFGDDQSEAFHGRAFPAMPLPGQAGALASSLGFDRDDLAISLSTVLVLMAANPDQPQGRKP
jgi:hypothetical protein